MEELLPILIILIGAVSSWMKKKKQSEQQKQQLEARKQAVQQAVAKQMEQQKKAAAAAPMQTQIHWEQPAPAVQPAPVAAPHVPLTPAPAQMGTEGEDACHEYMLDEPIEIKKTPVLQEKESEETARELVRGVIIGEILRRPAVKRYGRQA